MRVSIGQVRVSIGQARVSIGQVRVSIAISPFSINSLLAAWTHSHSVKVHNLPIPLSPPIP